MKKLLKNLFDENTVAVLSEIPNKKSLGIRETSRKTGIPVSNVYRIFRKLEEAGLLKKQTVGTFSVYEVNRNSGVYAFVEKLFPQQNPLEVFTNLISMEKTDGIYLLDNDEDKASIMIIGNIKAQKSNEIAEAIKKEFNFSIKVLTLTRAQVENMKSLNILPPAKKVLFKK